MSCGSLWRWLKAGFVCMVPWITSFGPSADRSDANVTNACRPIDSTNDVQWDAVRNTVGATRDPEQTSAHVPLLRWTRNAPTFECGFGLSTEPCVIAATGAASSAAASAAMTADNAEPRIGWTCMLPPWAGGSESRQFAMRHSGAAMAEVGVRCGDGLAAIVEGGADRLEARQQFARQHYPPDALRDHLPPARDEPLPERRAGTGGTDAGGPASGRVGLHDEQSAAHEPVHEPAGRRQRRPGS